MKTTSIFLIAVTLATGCVSTNTIGSKPWHTAQINQIDQQRQEGEITETQYRQLTEEADEQRDAYRKERIRRYKEAQWSRRRMGALRRSHLRPYGYNPYRNRPIRSIR
jgi:hypothetical protein